MPTPEQPSRGLPNWLKVLSAVFLLTCLAAAVIYVMGISATRRWEQLVRRLHEKGQPVTLREIEARRPVIPDGENISRLIERLPEKHEAFPERGGVPSEVFTLGKQSADFFDVLRRDYVEKSREYLEKHKAILEELAPILHMEHGRYPIDLSQPAIMIMLPSLATIRALSQFAKLSLAISLIDGKPDEAATSVLLQFRIADSLDGEPILISRLVQMSLERLAADSIEDCLRAGEPSKASLDQLTAALDRRLDRARMQPGLLGERAMFVDTCASFLDGRLTLPTVASVNGGPNAPWLSLLPTLPVWLLRDNQIKGTEMFTSLVDAGEDLSALLAAGAKLDVDSLKLSRKHEVVRIMMPSLARATALHVKSIALLRAARAAVAAEQFRLDHDRFPESLEELIPEYLDAILIDPFDGQPLRIKPTEQGIVIYSIDENRFDDGGEVSTTPNNNRAADIGLRLVRPELRTIVIVDPPAEGIGRPPGNPGGQ